MLYKKFLIATGILLALVIIFNRPIRSFIFKKVVDNIYKDSIVKTITLKEFAAAKNYLILDTRSKEEYDVSHLQNAIWVGYKEFDIEQLTHLSADTQVVVYCSIGYRSQIIGEKLIASGKFKDVRNLYGGIFNWFNKEYPVYSETGATDSIHTYSGNWGFFVLGGKKIN